MLEALSSVLVVQLALVVLALEAVFIGLQALRRGGRGAALDVLLVLAPGACLLVALLFALGPYPWPGVLIGLAAALPLHLLDLARRIRR